MKRTREVPSACFSMMSQSFSLYLPASQISPRARRCSFRMVSWETGRLAPCSWMSLSASRYPAISSSFRSRNSGLPKTMVATRDLSTSTPSMRLEETALSMRACSRKTFSRCGDCRVNNSCFPLASPKSARYHEVVIGRYSCLSESCRKVIIPYSSIIEIRLRCPAAR